MQIQSHLKPKAYVADRFGRPRYCATIWIDFLNGHLSSGTLDRYVNAVASIYRAAERMCPPVDLDKALLEPDLDNVEAVLTSYLLVQQSSGNLRHWHLALRFVTSILEYVVGIDDPVRVRRMRSIRQRFQQLSVRPRQPGPRIRSLPLSALENLYEIFYPLSESNPFRSEKQRWRNFVIFLLLTELGLRKGELLALECDAIKHQTDLATGRPVIWINVDSSAQDLDKRSRPARLKNANSRRELPISLELAKAIETYALNYRGDPPHPFLFSSSEDTPLAASSLDLVLVTASESLSARAIHDLGSAGIGKLGAHGLRHTSVVIRLQRFIHAGMEMEDALARLRPFYGWSRTSTMPFHYARAYFDPKYLDVFDDTFKSHLSILKKVV